LPINLAVLFVAFVAFRAIGLLVRARGSDLGYGDERFYLVPVLGDAQPRYVVREAQPAPEPRPEPIPLQPEELTPTVAFSQLLARNDNEGMIALLGKSGKDVPHPLLTAHSWMALAQKAWQLENGKAAAVALKRCLDAEPQGPLAPRAWLL